MCYLSVREVLIEGGDNAIKLREVLISSTWNRKALPPLHGTKVSVSKKGIILNLMALEGGEVMPHK